MKLIANLKYGPIIQKNINSGKLVDSKIVIDLLHKKIKNQTKYILDGVPRNLEQAKLMINKNIAIKNIFILKVQDIEIIKRISGRCVHPKSGRSYNIHYKPPKIEGKDDITGEKLEQRLDDTKSTVLKRLQIYYREQNDIIEFYNTIPSVMIHIIDASQPIDNVTNNITKLIYNSN